MGVRLAPDLPDHVKNRIIVRRHRLVVVFPSFREKISQMLSLRVLGGLSLTSSSEALPHRATQRRRLAILAVLAWARGCPVSRDRLVALLWPEADAARARHLLADSLYIFRDALGHDVVITAGDDVSLNLDSIQCDLTEFIVALENNDFQQAVSAYASRGAFLEGVHISDTVEFDRWSDSVRQKLAADYCRALEKLADEATARGEHGEAVAFWRRLAAEEKLSSRVALKLMRALRDASDSAGAIEFARIHETIVRAELQCAPDPAVVSFARELRHVGGSSSSESVESLPDAPLQGARAAPGSSPAENISASDAEFERETVIVGARPPRLPIQRSRVSPLLAGSIAVVALVATTYGATRLGGPAADTSKKDTRPSIVVLPLINESGRPESEAFADGTTEELTDALAKTGGLRVISRTSAFAFKGRRVDVRRIADSLDVANVLEGALQLYGPRLRMHLALINASDGSTRWSETYDRNVSDVFEVQEEISRAVSAQLSLRLIHKGEVHPSRHRTSNPLAYDLYLRGRFERQQRNDTAFRAAIGFFSRAIAADSSFAAAYAGLAESQIILGWARKETDPPRLQLFQNAESALTKAIALDDSLPEAHETLAMLREFYRIDLSVAAAEMQRAVELDPADEQVRENFVLLHLWRGEPDLALKEAQAALALDPMSVTAMRELGRALFYEGRYDESLVQLRRARTLGAVVRTIPVLEGEVYAKKKMFPEALSRMRAYHGPTGDALLGHTLARAGNRSAARVILADLIARARGATGNAFDVTVVYAGLGDYDNAFAWLEKSRDDGSLYFEIMSPTFDDLRADPRFARFAHDLRIPKH